MKPIEEKAANVFLLNHDFVKDQVLRYAPIPDLVDDICQQVFLEFVSKSDRWSYDEDIKPLLVGLVKNFSKRSLQEFKKNQPDSMIKLVESVMARSEILYSGSSEFEWNYEKEKHALKTCLERLPDRHRRIVSLYYFDDHSLRDIGELMLLSVNAVSHALCRIRERLRKCIRRTLLTRGDH